MAWVDILTHQEALRTPAIKISGPEKKDFEVRTCVSLCLRLCKKEFSSCNMFSYLSRITFCFSTTLSTFIYVYMLFSLFPSLLSSFLTFLLSFLSSYSD